VHIVAATSYTGVIGAGNDLPWRCKADMAHFKNLTTHGLVVMGRLTWESLPDSFRPLPNRYNVVISRTYPENVYEANMNTVHNVNDLNKFITAIGGAAPEIFIIGGAQIYRQCIINDVVDYMHLTYMDVSDEELMEKHTGKELIKVDEFAADRNGMLLNTPEKWYYMGGRSLDEKHSYNPRTVVLKNRKSKRRMVND
jgi:dihydrofolate reductase